MKQLFLGLFLIIGTFFTASNVSAVEIFHVDTYGATANDSSDDDRSAIQSAIDDAINWKNDPVNGGHARVQFGPGTYHLKSYHPSSNLQILRVWYADDTTANLTINGGGTTLVNAIWNSELIAFKDNKNVTMQNFLFDHNPLPYVDGVVDSVDTANRKVVISKVRGMNPMHLTPNPNATNHFGWLLDPVVAGRPKTGASSYYRASNIEDLQNNKYRFTFTSVGDINDFEVGDRFTYNERRGHNIRVNGDGSDYLFRWLTSYASNSFMFHVYDENDPTSVISDIKFQQVRAKILGSRWRSLNGDGIHITGTDASQKNPGEKSIIIDQCEFYGLGDDAIAIERSVDWKVENTKMENKRRHAIQVKDASSYGGVITGNTAKYNGGAFVIYTNAAPLASTSNNTEYLNDLSTGEFIVDNDLSSDGTYQEQAGTWHNSGLTGYDGSGTRYSSTPNAEVRWTPDLPMASLYKVYIYKVVHPNSDTNAKITVNYAGGSQDHYLDYTSGSSGWWYLGEYNFNAGTGGNVKLVRDNGHARADAVRFLQYSPPPSP